MNLMTRLKPRNEKKNPASVLVVTLMVMYLISGLLLLLLALLLYQMELSEMVVKTGVITIYIIAGFCGGFLIGRQMQDKKYLWGLLTGGTYFVVLFLLSFLVKQGMDEVLALEPLRMFTTFLLCAVSGMAGGMLS